jgi:integrase/recombinase XerD
MPRHDFLKSGLKLDKWPNADRVAWTRALLYEQGRAATEHGGSLTHLAAISVCDLALGYGMWLAWLRQEGLLDPLAPPASAVTPGNVRRYIRDLRLQYAPISVVTRISRLYCAAKAVAPTEDWLWLRTEWYRLRRRARAVTDKQLRLASAAELYACGAAEMKDADNNAVATALARALSYRDGLIVAILALRPIRLKNLAGIELGRNLVRRGASFRLKFDATETKTHYPYEAPLPPEIAAYLERYLTYYRPILAGSAQHLLPDARRLWLSIRGAALRPNSLYFRIVAVTRKRLGRAINPHAFRSAAATAIAWDAPEHVEITKTVLGHARLSTSEDYYNLAQSSKVSIRHQDMIRALREEARAVRRAGSSD